MSDNLLYEIHQWNNSKMVVAAYENKIIKLICEAVRDVIPDIEGWRGTSDFPEMLFFNSEKYSIPPDGVDIKQKWFTEIVVSVFPELKDEIYDNGIFLSPEQEAKILNKLVELRRQK